MKRLILTLVISSSLVGCYRTTNRAEETGDNTPNAEINNGTNNGQNGNNDGMNGNRDGQEANSNETTDRHRSYVTNLGFSNVVNPNGSTYHNNYRLNQENVADNDEIFHQWRHTWVEPSEYLDEDIHVYRYTGTLDGDERVIHVITHNNEVIGGYHHGVNETYEDARILGDGTYTSRLANDFRQTWDDMFNINR